MEIHQWAFHGMPMGLSIGGIHGMALWVAHGDPPMGIPWNAIGGISWKGAPRNGSMGSSWGTTKGVL